MKNIYLVNEDNHGVVSYWDNREDANQEALKIIKKMYIEQEENLTNEELLNEFSDCVSVESVELNRSWIS